MSIPQLLALIWHKRSPYITSAQALENAIPQSISRFQKFRSEKISTLQHQNTISLKTHRDYIPFHWKVLLNTTESKVQSSNFCQGLMPTHQRKSSKSESGRMRPLRWCVWSKGKYPADFCQVDSTSTFLNCSTSPLHLPS